MLSAQKPHFGAAFAFVGLGEILRTIVYVDGFNLYYVLKKLNLKWLNLLDLSKQLLPTGHTFEKVKYYTARVSGHVDPDAPRRQQVYINALKTVPEVEVFFGSFLAKEQWRPVLCLPIANRNLAHPTGALQLPSGSITVAPLAANPRSKLESLAVGDYPKKGDRRVRISPANDGG